MGNHENNQSERQPKRGTDLKIQIDLSFYEAVLGVEKTIKLKRDEECSECAGSGTEKGAQIKKCDTCQGLGLKIKERTITIKISAGVDNGSVLPLRGEANAGINHGENGDLFVYLTVKESSIFKRNGDDISYELPISYAQAVMGDNIVVPSIDGKINLRIPEGTLNGKVFRVKQKGITNVNDCRRGDQFITIKIELPQNTSQEQRNLLLQFEDSLGLVCYPEAKQFLESAEMEYKKMELHEKDVI